MDHDADLDAILAQLEAADLVEQYVNEDGWLRASEGPSVGAAPAVVDSLRAEYEAQLEARRTWLSANG